MSYDDPDTSDFFTIKNHVGDLVIIAVNEFMPNFPTAMGTRDTIKAEIAVVDGKNKGARYAEALIFGSKLVPQLRNKVGSVVLGRINTGLAKAGQSAPYILDKASPQEYDSADAWTKVNGDVNSSATKHVTGNTTTEINAGADEDAPF